MSFKEKDFSFPYNLLDFSKNMKDKLETIFHWNTENELSRYKN